VKLRDKFRDEVQFSPWQKRSDSYMILFGSIVNCVIMLLYQVVKKFRFWSLRLWVAEFCWARAVQLSTVLYKPPQTSNPWLRLLCEELQVWCKICFVHIPCSQLVSLMKGICFDCDCSVRSYRSDARFVLFIYPAANLLVWWRVSAFEIWTRLEQRYLYASTSSFPHWRHRLLSKMIKL